MSTAPVENIKNIQLKTMDGQVLDVPIHIAKKSTVLERLIIDLNLDTDKDDIMIPLLTVGSVQLKKIIDFLENHMDDTSSTEEYHDILRQGKMNAFDAEFIKMDNENLIEVYLAANFLGCDSMKELCAHAIAASVKGKTAAEMNELWNFESDFTPEEIEEVRAEKAWTTD